MDVPYASSYAVPALSSRRPDFMKAKNHTKSILLVGVGGQGILRASDILCQLMMEAGFDTKKSEVHGMAQRGGCVSSHVRYGKEVHSPLAEKGEVEILLSFEKLETLRYLDFMKPGGTVIINDTEIYPPSVNLGDARYPHDIAQTIERELKDVRVINAFEIAERAGNVRTENIALLGILSLYLPIDISMWEKVLRSSFPEKVVESNLTAFHLGRAA
jgi:indolepyruvate ferredoxin oxidoreductase, beta subunit